MKAYHGTQIDPEEFDVDGTNARGEFDTCFTADDEAAAHYAEWDADEEEFVEGTIFHVDIDITDDEIAREEDVARVIGRDIDKTFWKVVDEYEVREAVRAAGYAAIAYDDDTTTRGMDHNCIRVIVPGRVEIVAVEDIEVPW